MKRQLPPEVDKVKNWCLAKGKFEEANFIMDLKKTMESDYKISAKDTKILRDILSLYTLDVDLIEKMKNWRR